MSHVLIKRDNVVEQLGDFAIEPVGILGQADREVAAAQRAERREKLAAVEKVTRGLDVHAVPRTVSPARNHPAAPLPPVSQTAFDEARDKER